MFLYILYLLNAQPHIDDSYHILIWYSRRINHKEFVVPCGPLRYCAQCKWSVTQKIQGIPGATFLLGFSTDEGTNVGLFWSYRLARCRYADPKRCFPNFCDWGLGVLLFFLIFFFHSDEDIKKVGLLIFSDAWGLVSWTCLHLCGL